MQMQQQAPQVSDLLLEKLLPAEIIHFDQMQLDVLDAKLKGKTYIEIRERFGFKSDQHLRRYLLRTLLGNRISGVSDGRIPLLGDVSSHLFIERAVQRADMQNCIKTNHAARILEDIISEYLLHTYMLAQEMSCPVIATEIISRLEQMDFSSFWFTQFCARNNLHLVNAQTLERQRQIYCHPNVILLFHQMLSNIIHQVLQLLFNMDETASSYNGKGKVVVPNDRFPLTEDSLNIGHYTMLCCINAAGYSMKPFIIVPILCVYIEVLILNGMEVTSLQKRFEIACHYYKRQLVSIPVPNKEEIILGLGKDKERILTPPPPFFYFVSPTYLTIIYY